MPAAAAPRELQRYRTLGYATGTQTTQTRALRGERHRSRDRHCRRGAHVLVRRASRTSRVVRQHGEWKANRLSAPTASIRIWLWRGRINVAYFESPSKG